MYPLFGYYGSNKSQNNFSFSESIESDSLLNNLKSAKDLSEDNAEDLTESTKPERQFMFNPNTVGLAELKALGFKKYIAERIVKFRNAGGQFKIKSDIGKIYGIEPDFVTKITPFIDLPDKLTPHLSSTSTSSSSSSFSERKYEPQLIDLNTADTATLNKLRGIGNKLSQRIVNFREKLGGFYNINQLSEVYGLSPEVIANIGPRLKPVVGPLRTININSASIEELASHPYIKKNVAQIIVNYRGQHGAFKTVEEVLNIKVLDEMTFNKLKNYLKV